MRRVQFSDVVQVEYDVTAEGFIENDKSNFSTFVGNRQNTLPGRHETKLSLGSMVQDSENSEAEDEPNDRRRMTSGERRQSRAAQLLMAPAKWAQQKECRQRKMSLHGKPIYYTAPSRRKSEVRKIMILIFNFLERPGGGNKLSVIYHIATFLFVCASLLLTVFATIPSHKNDAKRLLFVLEIILVTVFTIELIARLWSAGCRVRYQGVWGRLRFARKPFCIIDITVVLSSFVIILAGNENHTFAATAMRGLRFLQILRMVRVDRRGGTWKLLGSVVYAHSKELITAWYIGFLALIFASFLVYQAEKDLNPSEFGTFADALWWGLITLTTIGYGDKTPRSWIGRLIACSFAILGISFFALPAGILGSGFALKVQEQHRQKHLSRRRNPAAYVIQCFWRCYAADADSTSTATWREGLRGYISHNLSMKKNLIRDKRLPSASTVMDGNEKTSGYESTTNSDFVRSAIEKLQGRFSNSQIVRNSSIKRHFSTNEPETDDDWSGKSNDVPVTDLSDAQKNAIRGFRMMKFLVAKRKFKEALRPYDVKDVIEQYSSGHIDMLSRVKNLQSRVDCIVGTRAESSPVCGRPVSVSSRSAPNVTYGRKRSSQSQFDLCNRGLSMNERLAKVETNVMKVERKIDLLLRAFKNQEEFLRNRMISQANHIANPSFEEYGKREDKLGKSVPSYTQKSNLKKRANIASDSSENKEVSDSGSTSKFSNLRLRSPRLSRRKSSRQEPLKIMMNNDTDDDESEDVFLEDEDSDETYNGLFPIRESPHLPPSVNISETSESEDLNSIETPDEDTFDGKSEAYVISKEQMRIQLNGAHESDCDVFIKSGTENSENFATPNGVSINSTITQSYVKTRTSNDDKTSA